MSTDCRENNFQLNMHQENVYDTQRQEWDESAKLKYMNESSEEEYKIDLEEFTIQSDSVKKEMDEEVIQFDAHYQPKQVNLNTIIKEENEYNPIGFVGNRAVMEQEVGLQNIKREPEEISCTNNSSTITNNFYCNMCAGIYEGYCSKCDTLSHILNMSSPPRTEWKLKSLPTNVLELRDTFNGNAVFALKTIPSNVIFGPFEGIKAIETTNGHVWKMKDEKLVNIEKGNWMKFINSTKSAILNNLDIFQYDGNLYFQTNRKIMKDSELLVHYNENEMLDNRDESYYTPLTRRECPALFSCTLCGFGFRLQEYLVEHKTKCPYSKPLSENYEIVQCECCKIHLEKQEYLEHHISFCWNNRSRTCRLSAVFDRTDTSCSSIKIEETDDYCMAVEEINENWRNVGESPSQSPTNHADIIEATNEQKFAEPFNEMENKQNSDGNLLQSDICSTSDCKKSIRQKKDMKFSNNSNLKKHVENKYMQVHTNTHTGIQPFGCDICNKKFTRKGSLKRHLNVHNGVKLFECNICKKKFTRKSDLRTHLNVHTGVKSFQCDICKKTFSQQQYLSKHLKTHTGVKPFQCDICNKTFTVKSYFKTHLNAHTGVNAFECHICKKKFTSKSNLKSHLNVHNDVKPFQCDICKETFTQKGQLERHLNVHTGVKLFECDICSKTFSWKSHLRKHLNTHTGVKPFQCDICSKTFTQKSHLKIHLNGHNGVGPFKCYICSKTFSSKSHLRTHLNVHSDVKAFECDICKKKFTSKSNLKSHLNVHNGVGPFKCDICSKTFSSKSHLRTHLDGHNGVKPFQCDICKKTFTQKSTLKTHLVVHNGVKAFKCDICKKIFSSKQYLKIHLNVHNGVKASFECNICNKTFTQKSSLKTHLGPVYQCKVKCCD